jgi:hypothetical protein
MHVLIAVFHFTDLINQKGLALWSGTKHQQCQVLHSTSCAEADSSRRKDEKPSLIVPPAFAKGAWDPMSLLSPLLPQWAA